MSSRPLQINLNWNVKPTHTHTCHVWIQSLLHQMSEEGKDYMNHQEPPFWDSPLGVTRMPKRNCSQNMRLALSHPVQRNKCSCSEPNLLWDKSNLILRLEELSVYIHPRTVSSVWYAGHGYSRITVVSVTLKESNATFVSFFSFCPSTCSVLALNLKPCACQGECCTTELYPQCFLLSFFHFENGSHQDARLTYRSVCIPGRT